MNAMNIQMATYDQIPQIMLLITGVVQDMESKRIYQWDEIYPNNEVIADDINNKTLYTVSTDGEICGIIVLNEHQEPEYQQVNWEFQSERVLVIHRLAVSPDWQGKGVGSTLMDFAEQFAWKNRYDDIRLDAFAQNPAALALYNTRGYRVAGSVTFRKGLFFCYEKHNK